MQLLLAIVIALVACADLASAWRMRLYKGQRYTGATSTKAGKGLPGSACHSINGFQGANLGGKFKSFKYWPHDPKYNTDCGVYFYRSSNCKTGKGSGYTGFFLWESTGTGYEPYYSMKTTCKYARRKRSEIEGQGNATAAALEAIDEEYLADPVYSEDLEGPDDWEIIDSDEGDEE
jgi:hypothetical protein